MMMRMVRALQNKMLHKLINPVQKQGSAKLHCSAALLQVRDDFTLPIEKDSFRTMKTLLCASSDYVGKKTANVLMLTAEVGLYEALGNCFFKLILKLKTNEAGLYLVQNGE